MLTIHGSAQQNTIQACSVEPKGPKARKRGQWVPQTIPSKSGKIGSNFEAKKIGGKKFVNRYKKISRPKCVNDENPEFSTSNNQSKVIFWRIPRYQKRIWRPDYPFLEGMPLLPKVYLTKCLP